MGVASLLFPEETGRIWDPILLVKERTVLREGGDVQRLRQMMDLPILPISWTVLLVLALVTGTPVAADLSRDEGLSGNVEISAFFDRIIPEQLVTHHIPGAAVLLVREGEVIFDRGYGYADLERGTPMDPDHTLVRVGSVSKILVWMAAMQCVDGGALDLDADINTYLGESRLPDTYPGRPVTMRHLMTHSAGFEERVTGIFASSEEELRPLHHIVSHDMPARVRPPGVVPAYSNHGAALAARVIEQVSEMTFATYAEERILVPLEMRNSTLLQPPLPALASRLAGGYTFNGTGFHREGFEFITLAPAGAFSATPADMGNLMICLLEGGMVHGRRAMEEQTVRRMHEVRFTPDPSVEGWRGGFMEMHRNGRYILWHGGDTHHSSCVLALLPNERTGFFVAYNAEGGSVAGRSLLQAFLDYSYPPSWSYPARQAEVNCTPSSGYGGMYVSTRSPVTTYEKIFLFSPAGAHLLFVREIPGGGIVIQGRTFCETEPGVFIDARGEIAAVFREDGDVEYLFLANRPDAAYSRLEWHEAPFFQIFVVVVCQSILLSVLLIWTGAILLPPGYVNTRIFGRRHLFFAVLCGLSVLSVLLVFAVLSTHSVFFGISPLFPFILLLLPGILFMALVAAVITLRAWIRGEGSMRDRVEFTLVTLAAFVFLSWASFWNLLRWHF